jgi:hypothetical protein
MAAGADSIDDMALLRHGGMGRVFAHAYAPSTLGSFLRTFTFGHVRQLDAVASRFLLALTGLTRLLGIGGEAGPGSGEYALLDVDDTIIEVHGHGKQGAGFGYTRVARAHRAAGHPDHHRERADDRGAAAAQGSLQLLPGRDATGRVRGQDGAAAARQAPADPGADGLAYFGRGPVHAALIGGAAVSVTVRMNAQIKAAIAAIAEDAWTTIEYTDAVFDEATGRWISRAEVAETGFTAFVSGKKSERVPGRLVVRRIPDFNAEKKRAAGQGTLFDVWRSTPSSPPPAPLSWTPSRRTRPTALTRSSSRSTPT